MAWKRSKDGGLDYDISVDVRYQAAINKMFGNEDLDERPQASWVVVHPEIAKELEPKIGFKKRLKEHIKSGGNLKHYYDD